MSQQYQSVVAVRKELNALIPKKDDRIEFDLFEEKDANKEKFLYCHLKDYDSPDFSTTAKRIKAHIAKNYSNAIITQDVNGGGRKLLIWIPKNSEVSELTMEGEGTYSQKGFREEKTPVKKAKPKQR